MPLFCHMGKMENTKHIFSVDRLALANSLDVTCLLSEAIARQGGRITFDQFMDIAMFAPGRGYYDSVNRIFGNEGDFTTAPEISPLFGQCIAKQILQVMEHLGQTNILEFGAGSGVLAQTILTELKKHDRLPENYYIYDISPTLRKRQFSRLKDNVPDLLDKLVWLDDIPENFCGIIIANEVLDTMPVHRVVFRKNRNYEETYVAIKNGKLVLEDGPLSCIELKNEMDNVMRLWPDIKDGYRTEINLGLKQWTTKVSQMLEKGLILLIDYGFTRREYYQPLNYQGNLMCYFQHQPHGDPLLYPGIQDVTCHVDFSLVAESFRQQGLHVAGYSNQGFFLAGCGLEAMYQELDTSDEKKFINETCCLEQLIMPNGMGEIFKVLGLTKGIDEDLIGFSVANELDSLEWKQ